MYFAHLLCSYFNFYFPQNSDPVISCHQRTAIRWKLSKFLPPNLQTYFYLNIIFISVFKMEKMPLLSKVKSHYFALDSLLPQHICQLKIPSLVLSTSLCIWLFPITILDTLKLCEVEAFVLMPLPDHPMFSYLNILTVIYFFLWPLFNFYLFINSLHSAFWLHWNCFSILLNPNYTFLSLISSLDSLGQCWQLSHFWMVLSGLHWLYSLLYVPVTSLITPCSFCKSFLPLPIL